MPSVDVDVVIVTHNSASLLSTAITPLRGHRVLVVDNTSTDGTADVARRLGAEVIESDANTGFGAAANRGIRATEAPYVLLLNPDASITTDALGALVARLDADPGLAIVSPQVRYPDGTDQRTSWPMPSSKVAWRNALGLGRFGTDGDQFLIGASPLIRRTAFDDVGGFDARFWLYAEESDLMARLQAEGWRIELVPEAVAVHVGGASGGEEPGLVLDHFERGGEHVVRKHHGTGALLSYRIANVAGSAIRSIAERRPDKRTLHRWRLRRTVQQLVRHPASVELHSPATRAPGKGIVVCSLEPWDEIWRRNQFLVRELLALDPNRRVLFVEPPFDWVHERRHPSGRRRQRGLRPLASDGRVTLFEPGKVWPRVLGPFADRSLRRQVQRTVESMGFVDPSLWVNDSSYAGLPTASGWRSLYDITDDWTQAGDGDRATIRVAHHERRLFAECDAVTVCSEGLATTRRAARPDLVLIPNAVDVERFRAPQPRPADLPDGPVAVYVGTLHAERLDLGLIAETARANPDWTFAFIGPNALSVSDIAPLQELGNVALLGPRPHDSVPGYLQHADVLSLPHLVSPFTESLDPIKAYEYLAVQRPVVATPVAGFRDIESFTIAEGADFVRSFSDVGGRSPDPRLESVTENPPTWADRAREFADAMDRRSHVIRRLLLAPSSYAPHKGGVEELTRQLGHRLHDAGIDVSVVTMRWPKDLPTTEFIDGIPVFRFVLRTMQGDVRRVAIACILAPSTLVSLLRTIRREHPDVVHIQCVSPAAWYFLQASRVLRVPLVVTLHGELTMDDTGLFERSRFARHVLRTALRRADAITACSAATLGEAERWFGEPFAEHACYIHNGVDLDEFTDVEPFEATDPYILGLGRLVRQKGFDVLLAAFAQLAVDNDTHRLLIAGDGPERAALLDQANALGIADRVRFLGATDRPLTVSLFKGASVFVLPSRHEPFGIVNLEAMAGSTPVVATRVGGVPEFVVDGETGLLVPPEDPRALAEAITRVVSSPCLRAHLVENGAAVAAAQDWSKVSMRYLDVLNRIAAPHPHRRRGRLAGRGKPHGAAAEP